MKEIIIGIDIGGTNSVIGFFDMDGYCLKKLTVNTDQFEKAEDFVERLAELIQSNITDENLLGIGIGAPSANYYSGSIHFAPNLRWKGIVPLVSMIKNYFDIPVIMTNDANAAAIGEMVYGGAKGMNNFIFITLGTGLGSGIVIDGKLVYGTTGMAGELGHTIVISDGRECGCGRKGCLETYCSSSGLKRTLLEMLDNSKEDSILRRYKPEDITSVMIFEAAQKNDSIAIQTFDFTSKILGTALANAVTFTSPEAIFLFGGLTNAGDLLFKPTERYMNQNMLHVFKDSVKLIPSAIDENNAAILGAAALIYDYLK